MLTILGHLQRHRHRNNNEPMDTARPEPSPCLLSYRPMSTYNHPCYGVYGWRFWVFHLVMVWVFFPRQSSAWRNPSICGFQWRVRLEAVPTQLGCPEHKGGYEEQRDIVLAVIGYGWLVHKCREKSKTLENELCYRPERWIGIGVPPVALRGIRLLWQLKSPSS